ncbi:MAG: gamma-glutamyltransferase [Acetobacteraceae bacterium]
MRTILAHRRPAVLLALLPWLSSCGTVSSLFGGSSPQPGQSGYVQGFLGGVVADEPRAALEGREVLSSGGNAADAAVAVAMTLAVTLPSRAGLGGGGACIAFASGEKSINKGYPEAILFVPPAPSSPGARADRPAALPMLARGMYLLSARYGSRPFETFVSPAEQLARFGVPVSRALARDIAVVAGPLSADPAARAVFTRNGAPLAEGQILQQPELASTITQLRVSGVGDMYQGALARRIEEASPRIGGPLTLADLRVALPQLVLPMVVPYRDDKVAFPPPPADGGLAAAAAFQTLASNPSDLAGAGARAAATAERWRAGGVVSERLLAAAPAPGAYAPPLPPLPASTSFAVLDRDGNSVVCALTMNNLFGTGRIVPGMGFLAAASPAFVPPPLLSVALAWNEPLRAFRAAVGGSGQNGAALATAAAMMNTLRTQQPMAALVPDPGRANVIACGRYLPPNSDSCGAVVDPREFGLAEGG